MASSLETECPVCREEFRMPKLLPCAHVLCRDCVLSWLRKAVRGRQGAAGSCPLCRDPIIVTRSATAPGAASSADNDLDLEREPERPDPGHVLQFGCNPDGDDHGRDRDLEELVDAFPTDHAALAMTEAYKVLNGPRLCGLCDDTDAYAVSYCFDCKLKLCRACNGMHAKCTAFLSHVTESLCSLTAERLASRGRQACAAHPDRYAELCCPAHRVAICALCVPKHGGRGCRVEVLTEFAEGRRQSLLTQGKRLLAAAADLKQQIPRLKDQLQTGQRRFRTALEHLNAQFDDLHNCLEQRRSQLVQTIGLQNQQFTQTETHRLSHLKQLRPFVTHQGQTAQRLALASPDCTLLDTSHALQPRLDELEEEVRRSAVGAASRDPCQALWDDSAAAVTSSASTRILLGAGNTPAELSNLALETAPDPPAVDDSPNKCNEPGGIDVSALSRIKNTIGGIRLALPSQHSSSSLSPAGAGGSFRVDPTLDDVTTTGAARLLSPILEQSLDGGGLTDITHQACESTARLLQTAHASAFTPTSGGHGNYGDSDGSGRADEDEEEKVRPMAEVLEAWRRSGVAYHRADAAGATGVSLSVGQVTPPQQKVVNQVSSASDAAKDISNITMDALHPCVEHSSPDTNVTAPGVTSSSRGIGDSRQAVIDSAASRLRLAFPDIMPVTSHTTSSSQQDARNDGILVLEAISRALTSLDITGATGRASPARDVAEADELLRVISRQIASIVQRHFDQQDKFKVSADAAAAAAAALADEEDGGALGGSAGDDRNTAAETDKEQKAQETGQAEEVSTENLQAGPSSSRCADSDPPLGATDNSVSLPDVPAVCSASQNLTDCLDSQRHLQNDEDQEQPRLPSHLDSDSGALDPPPPPSLSETSRQQHQQKPRPLSSPFTVIGEDFQNDDADDDDGGADDHDATTPLTVTSADDVSGDGERAEPRSPLRGEPEGCCAASADEFCSMRRQNLLNDSIEAVSRARSLSDSVSRRQAASKVTEIMTQREYEKKDWLDMLLTPLEGRWLSLSVGTRVQRGQDWSIFNEPVDGGPGGTGTVIRLGKGTKMMGKGWVLVRWNKTRRLHWHRMGAEGCCDLNAS